MRRSIRVFSILAIIVLMTESSYAAQRGQARGTQSPAGPRATAVKPVSANPVKKTSKVTKPPTPSPVQRKLQRNPGLAAKIGTRLPAGTNLMAAASGFRSVGQFVSAVNGSNTTRIPFAELKRRMAYDGMTLSQAIQDLRPKSDYRSQALRAETEAAALVGTEEVDLPATTSALRARR
jgi:hypothetical protein